MTMTEAELRGRLQKLLPQEYIALLRVDNNRLTLGVQRSGRTARIPVMWRVLEKNPDTELRKLADLLLDRVDEPTAKDYAELNAYRRITFRRDG